MALSARPIATGSAPSVPSGHASSGVRSVATASFMPVEDVSPKTGVHADADFGFQGFTGWQDRRQSRQEPLRNISGTFDTASSTFIGLLAQEQTSLDIAKPGGSSKGAFQGLLSKAIRAYEGTASVINGQTSPRGSSYSATL